MNTALLGRLSDLDDLEDHQPKTFGALTRCEACMELYPCSMAERAKAAASAPGELLEQVEVGWFLAARYPDQLDPPPNRIRGIVAGYRDDDERGRIFTLIRWKHGLPCVRELAARDVDPHMGDDALPNAVFIRNTYRGLAAHVGKRTGTADGTEVKYLAMSLALAQIAT